MPFVVVYDANALYGNAQRDLLIRIAQSGLVQAKWTDQILDEMLHNLGKKRPDIPAEKLGILRELMNKAVRDCLVTGGACRSRGTARKVAEEPVPGQPGGGVEGAGLLE
jgi:hypothetical protein